MEEKQVQLTSRHKRIRNKISGTKERPRLCIHRSLQNLQVQIIDDEKGVTLLNISTLQKELSSQIKYGGNVKAAVALGDYVAKKAKEKGINRVSFDRGGYLYHGRIKAFAEAARKGGLEF